MSDRKNHGLTIKGVGYVSPFAQQEKSTTSSSQQNAKKPRRGPYVMPSAPIKNVQSTSSNRIPMAPSSSSQRNTITQRFGSLSNLVPQKEEQCHCQHPADVEFLQDVYLENMRMRMEILELENKYLKGGPTEDDGTAVPSSSTAARGSISKKRVEFADRRLFGGSDLIQTESSTKQHISQTTSDQELFDKLEEAYQKEFRLQERIKALSLENKKLLASKDELEKQLGRLNVDEKSINRERHTLMEDNVELQRRLDDLTPLLAAKDAEIERLEMEKTNLIGKIRRLSTGTASRQESDDTHGNLAARRQELFSKNDEIEKLEGRLRQFRQKETEFNDEITTLRRKLKEEQMLIKREQKMREEYAKENDKLMKENSEISSKLSRVETLVERQERDADKQNKAQLAELRGNEERLHNEIASLEKRLKTESDNRRELEDQLRQQERDEGQIQESRRRMQEELQALKALSDSLSAENQGLRQEKISITQRMETLFEKLDDKEKEIRHLTQMLEEFQQRFLQIIERLRSEMQRQSEASNELNEIVNHARKISTNFSRSTLRSTLIKETVVEESSIKSPQRQHKTPSPKAQRIIEEDEDVITRDSSVTEELSEKDDRPILSPLTSPLKSKPPTSTERQQQNRSLRSMGQHERSITRTFSEDRQSTSSSLAQKYRRKLS